METPPVLVSARATAVIPDPASRNEGDSPARTGPGLDATASVDTNNANTTTRTATARSPATDAMARP